MSSVTDKSGPSEKTTVTRRMHDRSLKPRGKRSGPGRASVRSSSWDDSGST